VILAKTCVRGKFWWGIYRTDSTQKHGFELCINMAAGENHKAWVSHWGNSTVSKIFFKGIKLPL